MARMFRLPLGALISLLLLTAPGSAGAVGFGALGDSLSDEYLGTEDTFGTQTDLPALNWVQLLVILRGLDFGALEMDGGIRGEPRNQGYAHNWARAGATARKAPFFLEVATSIRQQAYALAPAVAAGDVEIVSINIGHNDYFYRDYLDPPLQVAGDDPQLFDPDDPSFRLFEQQVFNGIFDAVDAVLDANPNAKVALSYLPPGSLEDVAYLSTAMDRMNYLIAVEVRRRGDPNLVAVSFYDWESERTDGEGNLLFGGYAIPGDSKASLDQTVPEGAGPCDSAGNCATLDYALNLVAHDEPGGHPGTIMQALIANEFLEAVNPWLDSPVAILTDEEVLEAAAVPEPGATVQLVTSLVCLAGLASSRRVRR